MLNLSCTVAGWLASKVVLYCCIDGMQIVMACSPNES